ncbi:NAD-dependent epimerase/dehydratase family protein [Aureimonas glaciei]|uniref:Thymidine diphosphoglucose 4,6-dehydratase n=1 Tax=Aureimonas glaciei TaxID=1776957 RepID=A0A916XU02_9HYPH|nr:NAD(P)-dependent oxidoreductase [Aureimonas glaciei]GGD10855.1 thymidine diphosphoglucose 4,6-dehydratase [Aureimonas glaciei]
MKIAITGGSGFLGLAVAEAAAARGHEVLLLDLSPPPAAFARHAALSGVAFAATDVCDSAALVRHAVDFGAETIVHLAAITANAALERTAAQRIVDINVGGTAAVLQAAATAGIRRIVHLSSIAVYGSIGRDPGGAETLREDSRLSADSLYGISKQAAEDVARRLAVVHDLGLTILRLGPLFGPWEHTGAARPDLSPHAQILRLGSDARLPHAMRADWLYSRDAAAAIVLVLERGDLGGETLNLGAGRSSTPAEWAAAARLPEPVLDAQSPNVTARIPPGRPPMDIRRLSAACGYAGTRDIALAAADHMAWVRSAGLQQEIVTP